MQRAVERDSETARAVNPSRISPSFTSWRRLGVGLRPFLFTGTDFAFSLFPSTCQIATHTANRQFFSFPQHGRVKKFEESKF
jgi:hypothetical protein